MGSVVKGVVKVVGFVAAVALAIPTGGTSLLAVTLGVSSMAAAGIVVGLSLLNVALAPRAPKVPSSARDRLYATVDPSTPRKTVFGRTALATDIRYEEWGGSDQEYLDRIIAVASHKVQSIDEIWIEDKLAWTSAGGVQGEYLGYLTVNTRLEGTAGNTIAINGGGKWGTSRRLTGCGYIHLRYKTTGNSKKVESPFASSIPQRMTIIGRGAVMYDPRLDSTVGGSGSQRAHDQSTWAWVNDDVGNNPALQILWYLLGWRINGKLAVGRGIPPARVDMASFIAAANLCDENVTLAAGGTEKRYRSAGVVSEADSTTSVLDALTTACAGTLRDAGGKLSLTVLHNDLAVPVASFTDDDVIDEFDWQQTQDMTINEVRGRYTDPSPNSLYQLVDYPATRIDTLDGIERPHTLDLAFVQSSGQAQRIAKQELQRAQHPGVLRIEMKATAWRCKVGDCVALTFSTLGFVNKLFRVTEQIIRMNATVGMTLREEHQAIYAWEAEESPAVIAAPPTVYNPLNAPLIQAILEAGINSATVFLYRRASAAPAVPSGALTYTFATGALAGDLQGWAISAPAHTGDPLWITRTFVTGGDPTAAIPGGGWMTPQILAVDGAPGAPGTPGAAGAPATSLLLTRRTMTLWAYADGNVVDFDEADGQLELLSGTTPVTAEATLSIVGTNATGQINTANDTPVPGKPKGYYRVTGLTGNNGYLTLTAERGGQTFTEVVSISKVTGGYEIVTALPAVDLFEGRVVFFSGKLYRYTGGGWTASVDGADIANGSLSTAKFAAGLEPPTIVTGSAVPTVKSTNLIYLTGTSKLYRWNGTAYVATVPTTDLSGQIAGTQISDGEITTPKLTIANFTNLIPNPEFRTGNLANWLASASVANVSVLARTSAAVPAGAPADYVARMAGAGVATNLGSHGTYVGGPGGIEVQPGEQYAISVWMAASPAGSSLSVFMWGTRVDGSNAAMFNQSQAVTGAWAEYKYSFTVPANFKNAYLYFYRGAALAGDIFITKCRVNRKASSELIVDGDVKANHLGADSVVAGKVAAAAISGREVAAQALTGKHVAITDFENLIVNGDFAIGNLDGWSRNIASGGNANSVVQSSSTSWPSPYALRQARVAEGEISIVAGAIPFDNPAGRAHGIPLAVGEEIYIEGICFNENGGQGRIDCPFLWNNGDEVRCNPVALSNCIVEDHPTYSIYPASSTSAKFSGYFKNNTGQPGKAFLRFWNNGATLTAGNRVTWWILQARRRNAGMLTVDGSILTRHLGAESVDAYNIRGGAVDAYHVGTNELIAHVANIRTLTVDTLHVKDNAISALTYQYTDGDTGWLPNGVWSTIQTHSFTATGAPITVSMSALLRMPIMTDGFTQSARVRLLSNGSVAFGDVPASLMLNMNDHYFHMMDFDQPPPGPCTYQLQIFPFGPSADPLVASKRFLIKTELKK